MCVRERETDRDRQREREREKGEIFFLRIMKHILNVNLRIGAINNFYFL